ncbi:aldolase/citrate lyase family protein [Solirubrobacter taibaiensis]|nr:aldolase/citrate lyase family protein [Solirubrobacter taibaiensis]
MLIPLVESAEGAEAAVAAARFPPRGRRGGGPGRAALYGLDRKRALEREITVAVQIETAAALDNLDAILAVEGIDLIFVGPNDLALSLGRPADAEIADVLVRARRAGLDTGTLVKHADPDTTVAVLGTDLGLLAAGVRAATG